MSEIKNNNIADGSKEKPPIYKKGLHVRSDLKAGVWRCADCSGKTMGSSIYKADCDYCERA